MVRGCEVKCFKDGGITIDKGDGCVDHFVLGYVWPCHDKGDGGGIVVHLKLAKKTVCTHHGPVV